MFKNVTRPDIKRNNLEALGFYIFYIIIFLLINSLTSTTILHIVGNQPSGLKDGFNAGLAAGVRTSRIIIPLMSFVVTFWVVRRKNLNEWSYLYPFLAAFLAGMIGFIGLIPAAYLTTRDNG